MESEIYLRHPGWCPLCERNVIFSSKSKWLRDFFLCSSCGSIPRERALFTVIREQFPNYRHLCLHESSPASRGASLKLKMECANYSASQYYPCIPHGSIDPTTGFRCENLEKLTFPDNSFDILVTQDVMEHIFDYEKAFREIARVLKPGGAHIFSVPIVNKSNQSERWASRTEAGEVVYHREPEYHGNPVDDKGSLVTMHWGYDIARHVMDSANTPTTIVTIDDIDRGIRAEYIDILISRKR